MTTFGHCAIRTVGMTTPCLKRSVYLIVFHYDFTDAIEMSLFFSCIILYVYNLH